MVVRWIIFGKIFDQIGCSLFPKHAVMALEDLILYPIELRIHCFLLFFLMEIFSIPSAVELYVWMGIACCCWNISSRVTMIGSPAFTLWNNAPTYDSAADDITFFMMLESVSIALLDSLVSLKCWVTKKKFPPARLLECNSDRYDASLYMRNVIFMECNLNLEYGFVT